MPINAHKIASSVLNNITPDYEIIVKTNSGQINEKGVVKNTYITYNTRARIYLANTQDLKHINGININLIYKKFYLNLDNISGLNKQKINSGDYIIYDNIEYKIIKVVSQFNSGWSSVIGCQQ
jgi:hypothetical protein